MKELPGFLFNGAGIRFCAMRAACLAMALVWAALAGEGLAFMFTCFAARAGQQVTANYSGAAEAQRAPSEARLVPWKRPILHPDEETGAWVRLGLWLGAGIVAFAA
jgi:hypothetical protein